MKTAIFYASIHHQNTKKVAQEISKALGADLFNIFKKKPKNLEKYDLVGFGSGIYFWKHHRKLIDYVSSLPHSPNKKAFIFSTQGLPNPGHIFHRKLKLVLKEKGFEVVGQFSCRGWDTFSFLKLFGGIAKNHPNQADLKNARKFGEKLLNNSI